MGNDSFSLIRWYFTILSFGFYKHTIEEGLCGQGQNESLSFVFSFHFCGMAELNTTPPLSTFFSPFLGAKAPLWTIGLSERAPKSFSIWSIDYSWYQMYIKCISIVYVYQWYIKGIKSTSTVYQGYIKFISTEYQINKLIVSKVYQGRGMELV